MYRTGKSNAVISAKVAVAPRIIKYYAEKHRVDWGELPDDCPMPLVYEDFQEDETTRRLRKKQARCTHTMLKCSRCGLCQDNTREQMQTEITKLNKIISQLKQKNVYTSQISI